MRKINVIVLALALTAQAAWADKSVDVLKELVSGNHKAAINQLTGMAYSGDTDAQYQLAYIYATGTGTSRDLDKSMLWYGKAAKLGHKDAGRQLELMQKRRALTKNISSPKTTRH